MRTKTKVILGFGIGVGVGVGGTVVAQKCYEKYQSRLVEEFIDADIDDTVSGWDSEDDEDDFDDAGDGVLEETSEYPEEESEEEEDTQSNITGEYVVPYPPIRLTHDDDDQLPEEETEEKSSEEEVSEHADIINFVANGGTGDEKDSEDLSEDSPVETDDSKGSEPDDPTMVITSNNSEPEESDKPEEFSPEFVEMVQNSMDRVEEINYLLDEKRYQEAKKLYRTTLVPLIANDAFREKYPDGTKVIESIGDKITDTICTARRAAKRKAKEEKAARRNANKYANQRRNSSSMVQPMKQYNRRAR